MSQGACHGSDMTTKHAPSVDGSFRLSPTSQKLLCLASQISGRPTGSLLMACLRLGLSRRFGSSKLEQRNHLINAVDV